MLINGPQRALLGFCFTPPPSRHSQRRLDNMPNSSGGRSSSSGDFHALSTSQSAAMSVATWDEPQGRLGMDDYPVCAPRLETAVLMMFQNHYLTAAHHSGLCDAFPCDDGGGTPLGTNTVSRAFEVQHSLHRQSSMLHTRSFALQQPTMANFRAAEAMERWWPVQTTTNGYVEWEMGYNNVLTDLGCQWTPYSDYTQQPPSRRSASPAIGLGCPRPSSDLSQLRLADVSEFEEKDDAWFENFKRDRGISNNGLPCASYQETSDTLGDSQATSPFWNDDVAVLSGTISPKVLALSSSLASFSRESSLECESLSDTMSTHDGGSLEAGCDGAESSQEVIKQELYSPSTSMRHKLPAEPQRHIIIASIRSSDGYVEQREKSRMTLPRETKVRSKTVASLDQCTYQAIRYKHPPALRPTTHPASSSSPQKPNQANNNLPLRS